MNNEDIQFMKDYINIRVNLAQIGMLSYSETIICKIFIKILDELGEFNNE